MRISFETRENFSTFLAARLVFATVLLGVGALFRGESSSTWPYWILFVANTALSLGCWEWFRHRPPATLLRWFALTVAVVLDTFILRCTGGARSEFVFLYFFSIGSAGLLTGLPGSVWTALLSSLGIVWLYRETSSNFMAEHGLRAFVYVVNFVLTAVLSSYVFARLQDRERAHQATLGELEQTRLDTQAILDSLNIGVIVLDTRQKALYLNPASRSVLNLDSIAIPSKVESLFASGSEIGDAFHECLANLIGGATPHVEVVLGVSRKPVGMSVSALREADSTARGHILLISDLSAAKEAERLERERERLAAIGMLSRDLAHEIRNPLATVRGCVEVMQISQKQRTDITPYLDLALRESDRLNGLLRDFLLFAQLETPRKEQLDLCEFIRARVRGADLKVTTTDLLPEHLTAEFDSDQIALVVEGILLSLAAWAEGHGEIAIESGTLGDQSVRFTLRDICVPARTKEAAFQPFSDVQRISNGLALPTAMRAVHAHGGKLTLDSQPGVGTWFELAI